MESIVSLPSSSLFHLSIPSPSLPPLPPLRLPLQPHRLQRTVRLVSHSTLPSSSASSTLSTTDTTISGEKFNWYAHWYPVAPVCDLDKRAPHAKRILGLDIVVWWDRVKEQWQVFDDRCPHRLAPLSEGRIDQWGRLQCVYHGWCFNGSGGCELIPQASPDGPPVQRAKKACVAVYPSIVQNKIVWFWPSTDPQYKDIALKEKPPYVPQLDDPSYTCTMGMRDLQYGYEILTENLMDPAHVPYAHYGILTNITAPKALTTNVRDREGGRPLDMTIEEFDKTGFLSRNTMGYSKFIAPCLHYSAASLGSSNGSISSSSTQEGIIKTNQKQRNALLVFLCIPVSPGRSRLIYVFPRNFSVWVDQIFPRWFFHIRQNLVLDSDLYLLHLEEQKIAEVGPSNWLKACYVPTTSDAKVIAFRRWFAKYADSQVHWSTKFSNYLLPSLPKEQIMDRYWSHTVQCSSCRAALKGMKVLEVILQVFSVISIGILAAMRGSLVSTVTRVSIVFTAVLCFLASRWLSHFIYKNFYYHDYNHAFV
ncbi:protochlorophyllide-dependent translocon component 52, chloroplastic-like [Dioscorea cayenensis subsp. rotundata]|uniref:Protochlorophyllide-dependent translocon component 52, chloroplastic-like n=1 Tax=Dioscorea cayennensis subsp. rotundata TaxID=55577 RepID=A0AB40CLQ1_DIOCR|nr:protochlorophyllide-dependent translocon component 52, chloroplastic-like [Dioscorea cayenensis subsp. rotundata]